MPNILQKVRRNDNEKTQREKNKSLQELISFKAANKQKA